MSTKTNCAHCNFEMKAAIPFSGDKETEMRPGDLVICDKCLELNTLDEDANFIKPSQEYLDSIPFGLKFEIDKLVQVMRTKRAESQN